MTHESAMRLLHAAREQLRSKPTREIAPFDATQEAGINPYHREYEETVRYLLDNGYIEPHPDGAYVGPGLYRVTNKGLEEILSNP